jgi:hypothetical protein
MGSPNSILVGFMYQLTSERPSVVASQVDPQP